MHKYYVYILECGDRSFYIGMTNNLERRLIEHDTAQDPSAYTYSRQPTKLVWCENFQSPMAAITVEKQLKGWSRKKKEALIAGRFDLLPELAKSKCK